jgi:ATPase family associated with various cellular activities (AAA)
MKKINQTRKDKMNKIDPAVLKQLGNKGLDLSHRKQMALELIADEATGESVLAALAAPALDEEAQQAAEQVRGIVENLKRAPMRSATFLGLSTPADSTAPLATVLMDDGQEACLVVHDPASVKDLKLGDRVTLDGKASILIGAAHSYQYGKEAAFERRLDCQRIEVTQRDERFVLLADAHLLDRIDAGQVKPGDIIVMDRNECIAKDAVPAVDSLSHYRFLDKGPVPDVLVERDIGAPPRVIEEVARHVLEEMTRPELRRRFRLRPCITRLLCGVSGSGKTLAVQAIHRRLYDIMSEVTGTPLTDLPQRVFRFKSSAIYSLWLGESDKNADRLFDEVEKCAREPFTNAEGKTFKLPVLLVMEEAEGIGRARGHDRDGIYDRILSTMLQRLDPNRAGLAGELVVFLATTNEPHLIDPAFLRRIGGQVESFGRLDRAAFIAVLNKHIAGLPAQENGRTKSQKQLWRENVSLLEQWLYDEENDLGVVELSLERTQPLVKYRRDFLTGALIDRSVQDSSSAAWEESLTNEQAGISAAHLQSAITRQIGNVVKQLTPHNVVHYLDLPEGSRVTGIRSI